MKPIYLELSAFGPFAGQVILPLDQILTEGVFLVHGATGAGKTTIFDAISFALFGNASGENRPVDSFRSDFAQEGTKTYVILQFSHGGKEYKIERCPAYTRPKQRGEGYTESKADATLSLPDGSVIAVGYQAVTEKVEEILSMNWKQFKQISMIAQGEFLKLLTVDSKERGEIFRKVFHTGELSRIGRDLKERAGKARRFCEERDRAIIQYYLGIDNTGDGPYKERIDEFFEKQDIYLTENFGEMLSDMLKTDEQTYAEKQKQLQTLEEKLTALRVKEAKLVDWREKQSEFRKLEEELPKMIALEETTRREKQKLHLAQRASELVRPQQTAYETAKKEREMLFALLQEKEQQIKELKEKEESVLVAFQKAQADRGQMNQVLLKTEQMKAEVRQLTEKEAMEQELRKTENAYAAEEERLRKEREQISEQEKKYTEYRKLQDTLTEIYEKGTELERVEHELRKELADAENKLQRVRSLDGMKKRYDELTAEIEALMEERKEAQEQLREMEDRYTCEQAGMLALHLESGTPCPVCGATDHPAPAKPSQKVPDKEELEAKRSQCDALRLKIEELGKEAASEKGTMELLLQQMGIRQAGAELPDVVTCEAQRNGIAKRLEELLAEIDVLVKRQDEARRARELATELESMLSKEKEAYLLAQEKQQRIQNDMLHQKQAIHRIALDASYETAAQASEAMEQYIREQEQKSAQIAAAEKEYQEWYDRNQTENAVLEQLYAQRLTRMHGEQVALEEFEKAIQMAGFASEEEYREATVPGEGLEALENRVMEAESKVMRFYERSEFLKKELAKVEPMEDDTLAEQIRSLTEEKENAAEECTGIYNRMETNRKVLKNVEVQWKVREQMQKEYSSISVLSDVANGELSGRDRLPFEQYVQAFYFDQVIYEANLRLKKMSSGRFALLRKQEGTNKRSITGLELEVMDYFTGKARNVKSLSGGESFKAALAMALGLSDVIQQTAGGVVVETMFIDEGFGSLDKNSLEQAVAILKELAGSNRIVGIISHVEELKECIDQKIMLEKDTQGSRITWDK